MKITAEPVGYVDLAALARKRRKGGASIGIRSERYGRTTPLYAAAQLQAEVLAEREACAYIIEGAQRAAGEANDLRNYELLRALVEVIRARTEGSKP